MVAGFAAHGKPRCEVVASSAGEVYILWRRRSGGKISRTEERREGKRPMKLAPVEQRTARNWIKRAFGVLRIAVLILVAIGVVGSGLRKRRQPKQPERRMARV
jgi:hypothetical protein